jgi:hypothetical protein
VVELPEWRFCFAKAYRLLHAICETAVDDQMVRRNPCRIEGVGTVTWAYMSGRAKGMEPS